MSTTNANEVLRMLAELLASHVVTVQPIGPRHDAGELFRLTTTSIGRGHEHVYTGTLDAVIARAWAGQPDTAEERRAVARTGWASRAYDED